MRTCAEIQAGDFANGQASCPTRQQGAEPISPSQTVHRLFETVARNRPNAVALIFEERRWTYDELNRRANQLAHFLRKNGVGPNAIVGLRVERSPDMIAGILGILKAGAAYLPIDPAYPVERQKFILEDAHVRWLLGQSHLPPLESAAEVFHLDSDQGRLAGESDANPDWETAPENLAYVIYTSGSTGRPKGVLVTHANLFHSTAARFRYYPEPVANFLLLSSNAFDSSVAGIFWTLCQGGTLTLPHEYSKQTAFEPADLIARHRVSHLLCLPSLYAALLERAAALDSLRVVMVAGEPCPPALVQRHFSLLPRTELFNEYGPTEATVWATVHRCEPGNGASRVPIGRPIPGVQVYILDPQRQPLRNGEPGELYIGGAGVARGYLNQPELTAEKFVRDPFRDEPGARLYKTGDLARYLPDRSIDFLGRADNQVKIRGHRVELEEIEAALRQHESVQEVVVIARGAAAARQGAAKPVADQPRLVEPPPNAPAEDPPSTSLRRRPEFYVTVEIKRGNFIRPPRDSQRSWLLNRALDELSDDLVALDALAKRFVPGAETGSQIFTLDRTQAELTEQELLEDWHIPLMKAMARAVTETHGDILEIGFGRGVASTFLQQCGVRSHTIIECNHSVISRFFKPWREIFSDRDIRLIRGKWQDVIRELGTFDGIFFQTFPLNEREFADYLAHNVTFAEHFFPTAAEHLNAGGAFTYLTHEIDSLSRRHQRQLLRHFRSLTLNVEPLRLPPDCRDLWWADSMVVVKAIK